MPLSREEIEALAKLAGLEVRELVNTKSQVFKKMNVSLSELNNDDVIRLMQQNPRIIIRPLLTNGQQVLLRFSERDYHQFIFSE
jgi:arsenate reductase-like glutaredoxin family protein